jgi:hypothetical protein
MNEWRITMSITDKMNDFSIGARNKYYEIMASYNKKNSTPDTQAVANNYKHVNSVWTVNTKGETTGTGGSYTR